MTTRFGLTTTDSPALLETSFHDGFTYRLDLLSALPRLSTVAESAHELLWKLAAGEVETDEELQAVVLSLYVRYAEFRQYFDLRTMITPTEHHINSYTDVYVRPLTIALQEREVAIRKWAENINTTKLVYITNGYCYIMFRNMTAPPPLPPEFGKALEYSCRTERRVIG